MAESDRDRTNRRPRLSLREAATEVVRLLVEAGHVAYFAGGCVRDHLMGLEPTDYDVATSARPEQVQEVFPRAQGVGEAFGVMLVRIAGHVMEVATFRTDGDYADSRHPAHVSFTDAQHDAARRDFTINGLFENPLTNEIIDYVEGQTDLKARLIRAIGDPASRLREDHLRMLRAVRFTARFGFTLDEATAEAIRVGAMELKGISRERIGQEVKRMLTDPSRAVAAGKIQELGLDAPLLTEDGFNGPSARLACLPDQAQYSLALAAWLLDRHHVSLQRGGNPLPIIARWGNALILSNDEKAGLQACLEIRDLLGGPWWKLGIARQKRLAAGPWFGEALILLRTTDESPAAVVSERVAELAESGLAPPALIGGTDLIEMGLTPGPMFRRVLDAVYDAQLEGAVADRTRALDLAATVARSR